MVGIGTNVSGARRALTIQRLRLFFRLVDYHSDHDLVILDIGLDDVRTL
jgi:hypothetical protein